MENQKYVAVSNTKARHTHTHTHTHSYHWNCVGRYIYMCCK